MVPIGGAFGKDLESFLDLALMELIFAGKSQNEHIVSQENSTINYELCKKFHIGPIKEFNGGKWPKERIILVPWGDKGTK